MEIVKVSKRLILSYSHYEAGRTSSSTYAKFKMLTYILAVNIPEHTYKFKSGNQLRNQTKTMLY